MKSPVAFILGFAAAPTVATAALVAWLKIQAYQDEQYARRWWEYEHWREPGWPSQFHILSLR